jgi:hypothetical protein
MGGMMKRTILAVLFFLALGTCVSADTFDFTISMDPQCGTPQFQAVWGTCNPIQASGVMTTTSMIIPTDATQDLPPCIGPGSLGNYRGTPFYEILSMTGELNGNSISFTPQAPQSCTGQLSNLGPGESSNLDFISFTAGNQIWSIQPGCDFDVCTEYGIWDFMSGQNNFIELSVMPADPVPTPEPTTWSLALLSLIVVGGRRIRDILVGSPKNF